MIEPFLMRALLAALGLAIIAAPLGCVIVWSRMSYFGEAMAQASLVGVALGLLLKTELTASVLVMTVLAALMLIGFSRQRIVPVDSVLGLMHYGALALGVIVIAGLRGQSVDIVGYLFGDLFAVTSGDLWWLLGIGLVVSCAMLVLWQPLIRMAVHEDLAKAEGMPTQWVGACFMVLLALTIAIAIKIVGILLAIAFLIVPVVAARPFAPTPEIMVLLTGAIASISVLGGLLVSVTYDVPGGPAIVLLMTFVAALSLTSVVVREKG